MDDSSTVQSVRVTTRGMAYGPYAVALHDGKVLFVRGAAPDEEVEVVVREDRRTYAYADLVRVVRPSAARRPAPCPYLPRCGGCPWQHLDYGAQLAAKREIVHELLRRIAGLDVPVDPALPSPRALGCRRRIKLRVEHGALGYYAGASHELVPVDHCLLAEAGVDAGIAWAAEWVRVLRTRVRRVELIGCDAAADAGLVVAAEAEGGWDPRDEGACRAWLAAHPDVRGLAIRGRGSSREWGDLRVRVAPQPDLVLAADARAFTQVNPAANQLLVDTVVRFAAPAPGVRILDLFAGAGNLSLALRRHGARVVAVERDRRAAAAARADAERHPGPPLQVLGHRAERALEQLARDRARFDVAVLDPPRSGAAGCVAPLLRLAPSRIVYVSCDPATLARDLKALAAAYRVDAVQPIDMFPQTYHVESVVCATLSC